MKYDVTVERVSNGYRASVPALPGCWVVGVTQAHAMNKVEIAIGNYLAALDAQANDRLENESTDLDVTP